MADVGCGHAGRTDRIFRIGGLWRISTAVYALTGRYAGGLPALEVMGAGGCPVRASDVGAVCTIFRICESRGESNTQ